MKNSDAALIIPKLELRKLSEFQLSAAASAREHSAELLRALERSIMTFGLRSPMLVTGRQIVQGAARWKACQRVGLNLTLVRDVTARTPEQIDLLDEIDAVEAVRWRQEVDALTAHCTP